MQANFLAHADVPEKLTRAGTSQVKVDVQKIIVTIRTPDWSIHEGRKRDDRAHPTF